MRVFLTLWISAVLIQEVIPGTLVRLPRHASKLPATVQTEYEAKYEQTGQHGNETSGQFSGKQEIVHDNCADDWNAFADKCAALIKDLVASLANTVTSRPGDATKLQLQIKNTFKHFDGTNNCSCLDDTKKTFQQLDLSPLLYNLTVNTVAPTGNSNIGIIAEPANQQENGESDEGKGCSALKNGEKVVVDLGSNRQGGGGGSSVHHDENFGTSDCNSVRDSKKSKIVLDNNPGISPENEDCSDTNNNGRRETGYSQVLWQPENKTGVSHLSKHGSTVNVRRCSSPFIVTPEPSFSSESPTAIYSHESSSHHEQSGGNGHGSEAQSSAHASSVVVQTAPGASLTGQTLPGATGSVSKLESDSHTKSSVGVLTTGGLNSGNEHGSKAQSSAHASSVVVQTASGAPLTGHTLSGTTSSVSKLESDSHTNPSVGVLTTGGLNSGNEHGSKAQSSAHASSVVVQTASGAPLTGHTLSGTTSRVSKLESDSHTNPSLGVLTTGDLNLGNELVAEAQSSADASSVVERAAPCHTMSGTTCRNTIVGKTNSVSKPQSASLTKHSGGHNSVSRNRSSGVDHHHRTSHGAHNSKHGHSDSKAPDIDDGYYPGKALRGIIHHIHKVLHGEPDYPINHSPHARSNSNKAHVNHSRSITPKNSHSGGSKVTSEHRKNGAVTKVIHPATSLTSDGRSGKGLSATDNRRHPVQNVGVQVIKGNSNIPESEGSGSQGSTTNPSLNHPSPNSPSVLAIPEAVPASINDDSNIPTIQDSTIKTIDVTAGASDGEHGCDESHLVTEIPISLHGDNDGECGSDCEGNKSGNDETVSVVASPVNPLPTSPTLAVQPLVESDSNQGNDDSNGNDESHLVTMIPVSQQSGKDSECEDDCDNKESETGVAIPVVPLPALQPPVVQPVPESDSHIANDNGNGNDESHLAVPVVPVSHEGDCDDKNKESNSGTGTEPCNDDTTAAVVQPVNPLPVLPPLEVQPLQEDGSHQSTAQNDKNGFSAPLLVTMTPVSQQADKGSDCNSDSDDNNGSGNGTGTGTDSCNDEATQVVMSPVDPVPTLPPLAVQPLPESSSHLANDNGNENDESHLVTMIPITQEAGKDSGCDSDCDNSETQSQDTTPAVAIPVVPVSTLPPLVVQPLPESGSHTDNDNQNGNDESHLVTIIPISNDGKDGECGSDCDGENKESNCGTGTETCNDDTTSVVAVPVNPLPTLPPLEVQPVLDTHTNDDQNGNDESLLVTMIPITQEAGKNTDCSDCDDKNTETQGQDIAPTVGIPAVPLATLPPLAVQPLPESDSHLANDNQNGNDESLLVTMIPVAQEAGKDGGCDSDCDKKEPDTETHSQDTTPVVVYPVSPLSTVPPPAVVSLQVNHQTNPESGSDGDQKESTAPNVTPLPYPYFPAVGTVSDVKSDHSGNEDSALYKPTTFQTTASDPTPPQSILIPTESTIPLTHKSDVPQLLGGSTPVSSHTKESHEDDDDDDDDDCCDCESFADYEITDPKKYKENACKNLEEARRELKAIFDKIKKKLKCGRCVQCNSAKSN